MAYTLSEIRPADKRATRQLVALLEQEGIRLDAHLDYTCGLFDDDYNLCATGSTFGKSLRCFAVDRKHQGEGLLNQVVGHLMDRQCEKGIFHQFVYTKPDTAKFFHDLGFYEIARVKDTLVFLENKRWGFASFCRELMAYRKKDGVSCALVMNANPFTLGHRYLLEWACEHFDHVHLFVLSEDASLVPFWARWKLVLAGTADLPQVICHKSGPYIISKDTFPSYFLKDEEAVIRGQAMLDLELFCSIAAALGAGARVVGEEPKSLVTAIYNRVMAEMLPEHGIECCVVPRLEQEGEVVSASTVRKAIAEDRLEDIRSMVPPTTWEFFSSEEAAPIIRTIKAARDVVHY